jgi:hypothetical protein
VSKANGIKTLISSILDPKFKVLSETVTDALLYVLDNQETRKYVRPKYDLQVQIKFKLNNRQSLLHSHRFTPKILEFKFNGKQVKLQSVE